MSRRYLQDEQGQEVQVGRPLELLVQVQRDEGEDVVLVRLDGVFLQRITQRLTPAALTQRQKTQALGCAEKGDGSKTTCWKWTHRVFALRDAQENLLLELGQMVERSVVGFHLPANF